MTQQQKWNELVEEWGEPIVELWSGRICVTEEIADVEKPSSELPFVIGEIQRGKHAGKAKMYCPASGYDFISRYSYDEIRESALRYNQEEDVKKALRE
jgi:hypothetical protein